MSGLLKAGSPPVLCLLGLSMLVAGCTIAPEPLTRPEIGALVGEARASHAPDTVYSGLGLTAVVRRAIANSPELNSARLEKLVALGTADFSNRQVLIGAMLNVGYDTRSSDGDPDTYAVKDSVTFYWNALDFGISYLRAKTSANAALISQEEERRDTSKLVLDVVKYWHLAKFHHENRARIAAIKAAAGKRFAEIEAGSAVSPEDAISRAGKYSELADSMYWLVQQEDAFRNSLYALNNALGASPDYVPARFGRDDLVTPASFYKLEALMQSAVLQRPEVRNAIYEARNRNIGDQSKLLSLLPLPRLAALMAFETTGWFSATARLVGNLANLVAIPEARKIRAANEELSLNRLVAIASMVQMQVGLAYIDMVSSREQALWARYEQRRQSVPLNRL